MANNWDLSDLYQSIDDPAIKNDQKTAEKITRQIETHRLAVSKMSPGQFLRLIQTKEKLFVVMHRLSAYVELLASTHIGIDVVTRFEKGMDQFLIDIGQRILFIDVELAKIEPERWAIYQKDAHLKPYALTLVHSRRHAAHTLSEPEEKILAEKSQTSERALNHLFTVTTDTLTVTLNGKPVTVDEAIARLRHPEARTRKNAAVALHAALKTNNKTTHAIYNALIHDKAITDRLRRYTKSEQSRLDADDVDALSVQAMVAAVSQSTAMTDYYRLKRRVLGVHRLYWWDRYAPLPQPKTTFSRDQAIALINESFGAFSAEFAAIVQKIVAANHIDWLPSPRKRDGAFCAYAAQGQLPYVLVNFTGTIDDVHTLAHELGHAVHAVLAGHNTWLNVWPSLALAEIASTFGEQLLFDRLMSEPKLAKRDKISLLMHKIEGHLATVHRQVSMFEFEQMVHAQRAQGGELAKRELDELWHKIISKPFGDALEWTDEHKNFWMYIGHFFHTPFYVYSYAFAQLCTLALVQMYRESDHPAEFKKIYTSILKDGGSAAPKDILTRAGLDINRPDFWSQGLALIDTDIAELRKLVES